MRPDRLTPLFASAAALPGIGPKTGKLLDRLLGTPETPARILDVLFHLPHAAIDRRTQLPLAQAPLDTIVTVHMRVVDLLADNVKILPGVLKTDTMIALYTAKETTKLPFTEPIPLEEEHGSR